MKRERLEGRNVCAQKSQCVVEARLYVGQESKTHARKKSSEYGEIHNKKRTYTEVIKSEPI
jgi:hypothetical protein